jgi:hypothetical protein
VTKSKVGRRDKTKRAVLAVTGVMVFVLLGGCGSSGGSGSAPTTSTAPSPRSQAPTTSTTSTTSTTTTSQTPAGFVAAKHEWQQGAAAISADQGTYLNQAATDLSNAIVAGEGNTSGYSSAVQELQQLASLPDADQTPAQNSEFQSDTMALNTFFGTSGLYQ